MRKRNAALSDVARRAGRLQVASPRSEPPILPVHIDLPGAKIMLLPGRQRDAAYVRRHVDFVLSLPAEKGEAHVQRNLHSFRLNLRDIGANEPDINREAQRLEGVVRAELWRRVLLGDGE